LDSKRNPDSVLAQQLAFWTGALDGLPEQLDLPADRARPAQASHRGATLPFTLSADLHRRLAMLARESQTTLFMVLQAGLAALLSRLSGGEDIPIGSSIAGRTDRALEDLVGFFVNTIVLRTDTSGSPTFRELLERVRIVDVNAFAHQDLPFERLVEAINPARSLARHPLFQVMLALQNEPEPDMMQLPGLTVAIEPVDMSVAKFDLLLALTEQRAADGTPRGLRGVVEYSTDLFDRSTVEGLARRLMRLLDAVTITPELPIGRIPLAGRG